MESGCCIGRRCIVLFNPSTVVGSYMVISPLLPLATAFLFWVYGLDRCISGIDTNEMKIEESVSGSQYQSHHSVP